MMNVKYYLRGLGIGVIVTALIMGITAGRSQKTLSNEEIKERARALGMTEESNVLATALGREDNSAADEEEAGMLLPSPSPEAEEEKIPESPGEEFSEAEDETLSEIEGEAEPEPEGEIPAEAESEEQEEASRQGPSGEFVTIQVESGEGSFIVCQKLEDAGLVPLASEFDRYLYNNGFDKRINVGTYEIPVGAAPEEIAKIIAKMN